MITHAVESEPSAEDILRLDDLLYAYNVYMRRTDDKGQSYALVLTVRRDGGVTSEAMWSKYASPVNGTVSTTG